MLPDGVCSIQPLLQYSLLLMKYDLHAALQTQQGALDMLENVYIKTGGTQKCFGSSGGHGSGNQVEFRQVAGLWYIFAIGVGSCFLLTLVHNIRKDPKAMKKLVSVLPRRGSVVPVPDNTDHTAASTPGAPPSPTKIKAAIKAAAAKSGMDGSEADDWHIRSDPMLTDVTVFSPKSPAGVLNITDRGVRPAAMLLDTNSSPRTATGARVNQIIAEGTVQSFSDYDSDSSQPGTPSNKSWPGIGQ